MSEKISQKCMTFEFDKRNFIQTFTDCMSNQYTHFDILRFQM